MAKKMIVWVVVCLVGVMTLNGCAPLRKKFVRQKKKSSKEKEIIPVFSPTDYAARKPSIAESYKYHYSLWQVYNKDFMAGVEEEASTKRQKFMLEQIIKQIEGMRDLLTGEKQGEIEKVLVKYQNLQKKYDQPPALRSKSSIIRALRSAKTVMRSSFKIEHVEYNLR